MTIKYEIRFIIEDDIDKVEELYDYLWKEANLFSNDIVSASMRRAKDGD